MNPISFEAKQAGYSHPDQPVRHSYPLAIRDASLSTAFGLLMRTLPYAGARFAVLFSTTLATVMWWVVAIGGMMFLSRAVHELAGFLWFLGWAFAYGWVWRTFVRYFLYLLKAGHIAVLTELITHGQIGDRGENMFAYGKRVVTEHFGQVNALLALDLLVSAIVRAFNRTLDWLASLLPLPGVRDVTTIVERVVKSATTFIDETMLSYSLARGDADVFAATRDGLIYYAQNSREVLKTGIWIVVLDKVITTVTYLVMFLPAIAVGALLPHSVRGMGILFVAGLAAMFAWAVRTAFLQPLCLTMVMIKFHVCVKDQPINLEWDGYLSQVSNKFVELKNRVGGPLVPTPSPNPSPRIAA